MTLEVDRLGNVLKSLAIGYGRRIPDAELSEIDQAKQAETLITYVENNYTNAVESDNCYRMPMPCESRAFELTGYAPTNGRVQFRSIDFVRRDAQGVKHIFDSEVGYEQRPTSGRQRRCIEHTRTYFRPDDLGSTLNDPLALLPLGVLESLALPGENYTLAFTPELSRQIYVDSGKLAMSDLNQILVTEGKYVHTEGDANWWIPSGRVFLSPPNKALSAEELTHARKNFFLPHRYRNPFHTDAASTETLFKYDAYDLLMVETRDALGNRITVGERLPNGNLDPTKPGNDYRVLQPWRLMDPNRNRTQVALDTLGMVVGTAVMGKPPPTSKEGDSLNGFVADLTQHQIEDFFAQARQPHPTYPESEATPIVHNLLGNATTRIVYDLKRFSRTHETNPGDPDKWEPTFAATIARETHVSDLQQNPRGKLQLSFSYSDGFGREIQKKIQAEPGPFDVNNPQSPIANPRWVGSGWTIFNNKGKPVRQYEPFFSKRQRQDGTLTSDHRFEFHVTVGVSPVLFYDPAERIVATLHPNHTYEKVVFDPWQQTTYDVNDSCAPRNGETGDPRTDPDIQGYMAEYFKTQPATWRTWHEQRIGGAMGPHERTAAQRATAHADTPTTAYFDALGRPFLTVARNRVVCPGHNLDGTEDSFGTRVELDIEGNQRAVCDERKLPVNHLPTGAIEQRIVMRYAYDMLGNRIHQLSMEADARWMLGDVAGKPIRAWDSRGHNFTTTYDALRRPVEQTVRGTTTDSDPRTLNRDILVDKIEYGEPPPNATDAQEREAQRLNLRTRIYRLSDSAGTVTNARLDANGNPTEAFDFKGNLLHSTRHLVSNYKTIPDWLLNPQLEAETFESSTRYDALNRPIQSIVPHSNLARAKRHVIQPVFNEAKLLERVDVWLERTNEPAALLNPDTDAPSPLGVKNIHYDAKGQRLCIDYKNGASTRYLYDPDTFRLIRLRTVRGNKTGADCTPVLNPRTCEDPPVVCRRLASSACIVQDLQYTYDPAGNITHIQDSAQQIIYFKNRIVEPSNDYTYDAIYRLIQGTGREHLEQQANGDRNPPTAPDASNAFHTRLDHPGNGNAMGTYIERYLYDAVGNFLQMQHRGSDPVQGWTRVYDYLDPSLIEDGSGGASLKISNLLTSTTLNPNGSNPQIEPYQHDAHGNIVRMPHLGGGAAGPNMHWDYKDQIRQTDLGGGGTACYVYDASGQRVRKVWEKARGLTEERIYLGGFEIFRKHSGPIAANTATLECETLHMMDDKQRIALVETRTLDTANNDPAPRQMIRYQFGNHLGSAYLELDDQGQIISYEEYTPYGSTSYQAVRSQTETPKRYRYTGKERDDESGLYYHGARYYAPWIGRWSSADPIWLSDGLNLYEYVHCNPIYFKDSSGMQESPPITDIFHRHERYWESVSAEEYERGQYIRGTVHLIEASLWTVLKNLVPTHEDVFVEAAMGPAAPAAYVGLTGRRIIGRGKKHLKRLTDAVTPLFKDAKSNIKKGEQLTSVLEKGGKKEAKIGAIRSKGQNITKELEDTWKKIRSDLKVHLDKANPRKLTKMFKREEDVCFWSSQRFEASFKNKDMPDLPKGEIQKKARVPTYDKDNPRELLGFLEDAFDEKWYRPKDFDELSKAMEKAGEGSSTYIVGIGKEGSHMMNVIFHEGNTVVVDTVTGEIGGEEVLKNKGFITFLVKEID